MGQQNVYMFLQKHPDRWFTAEEISKTMGIEIMPVRNALRRLRKLDDVYCSLEKSRSRPYYYKFKE